MAAKRQTRKQGKGTAASSGKAEYVPFLLANEGIRERLNTRGIPMEAIRDDADALDKSHARVWVTLDALERAGMKGREPVDRESGNPAFLPYARYVWESVDAVRAATDDIYALHDAHLAECCAQWYAQDGSPNFLIIAERMLERARLRAHSPRVQNERRILEDKARRRQSAAERNADIVRRIASKVKNGAPSLSAAYMHVARELDVSEHTVRHAWERRVK